MGQKIFKKILIITFVISLFLCFSRNAEALENERVEAKDQLYFNTENVIKFGIATGDDNGITIKNLFEVYKDPINCEEQFQKTIALLNKIFSYVRIGAVILFVILSSTDFIKAMALSDAAAIQKNNKKTLKRLGALIAILILPTIIKIVTIMVQLNNGTCGIK